MKKISIIMPVYNEERTISDIVKKVKDVRLYGLSKEIIIVDDCSTDNTRKILDSISDKSIKVIHHKENKGKGAAIRTAIENSTGNILAIQDADLEYDPANISKLVKPILEGDAQVVYGTRFSNIKLILFGERKTPLPIHFIGNRGLTFLTNMLYLNSITDMETGCKIFERKVLNGIKLRANRFEFEPEITAKILKKGIRIMEVPIDFHPRTFDEGKKITWKDGIKAAYYLIKYRFLD